MNPLISVNLTTHNRAHLLPGALDSILEQSYSNLEIVIVDDCSQDNTSEIVHRYQQFDSRIKYIRNDENKKLGKSRNIAWQASGGKYIATMDDDDVWIDCDKLYKQVCILEKTSKNNVALVCSSIRFYRDEGSFDEQCVIRPKNLTYSILIGNGIIHTSTAVIRKTVLEEVGGFDEKLPRGVDSEFYRRCIVKHNYDVYFMTDITVAYRAYGNDRITPKTTRKDIKIEICNLVYLFQKYNIEFIKNPRALSKRLKQLLKNIMKLLRELL